MRPHGTVVSALFALVEVSVAEWPARSWRLQPRNSTYTWAIAWRESTCSSWPCKYLYDVEGPQYVSQSAGVIPYFLATCLGTVDKPLVECQSAEPNPSTVAASGKPQVLGNFSTYETSGVGAGVITVTFMFQSTEVNGSITLTASTPLQTGNWTVSPSGLPDSMAISRLRG
ncbi:hypothetical protein BJ170DRAFT_417738 [Xylariales sp. AK1849]|nr:hypothetical protein BJ170DRAFT_417738 [Xylariales sp. AK1849]